jgi:hypothetical protein
VSAYGICNKFIGHCGLCECFAAFALQYEIYPAAVTQKSHWIADIVVEVVVVVVALVLIVFSWKLVAAVSSREAVWHAIQYPALAPWHGGGDLVAWLMQWGVYCKWYQTEVARCVACVTHASLVWAMMCGD